MNGIILPVIIQGIRSLRDGSVSISLETQELSPSKAGEVFSLRGKVCIAYISPKDVITQSEIKQMNEIEPDLPGGKTPSQRMRNVLYILWKQDAEGYKDFPQYYEAKMSTYIEGLKQNIKD